MEGPSPLEAVPCLTAPKQMSWSWVPKGMDRNTACRIAVCVGPYVDERCQEYNVTRNFRLVIDRDTANLKDLLSDLAVQVKHGNEQSMILTFWDKNTSSFVELKSDTCLLYALDMYWDVRKLPLSVTVTETETEISPACDQQCSGLATDHGEPPLLLEHNNVGDGSNTVDASKEGDAIKAINGQASAWTDDQIKYVGLNDKTLYRHLQSDSESGTDSDYSPSDEDPDDDEHVDDGPECGKLVHVTNLENPKIDISVTFEDGECFKKAIRHYAVLNEFDIIAPYCKSTRYRGRCKAKKCKWRIHASQLQDGRTWQIKRLQPKHNCASTAKLDMIFSDFHSQVWSINTNLFCAYFFSRTRLLELEGTTNHSPAATSTEGLGTTSSRKLEFGENAQKLQPAKKKAKCV